MLLTPENISVLTLCLDKVFGKKDGEGREKERKIKKISFLFKFFHC